MSTSDTINALNQRNQQLRQLIEDTKTVGIDIDGVLSDTIAAAIEHIRTRYSYTMQYEKWSHWNPHQIPELANLGKTDEMQPENFFYQFLREDGSPVVRPIE